MHLFCFPNSKNTSDKYLTKWLTLGFILLFFFCWWWFLCFKKSLTEFLGILSKRKLMISSVRFVYTFINYLLNCSFLLINWNKIFLNPVLSPIVSRPNKFGQSLTGPLSKTSSECGCSRVTCSLTTMGSSHLYSPLVYTISSSITNSSFHLRGKFPPTYVKE